MRKCPRCGSGNIEKEIIRGHRTGDLVCNECKYADLPSEFERPSTVYDIWLHIENFRELFDQRLERFMEKNNLILDVFETNPQYAIRSAFEHWAMSQKALDYKDPWQAFDIFFEANKNNTMYFKSKGPEGIDISAEIDALATTELIKKSLHILEKILPRNKHTLENALRRSEECVNKYKNILDLLPDEIKPYLINDYAQFYQSKDKVIESYSFIKNEKDVFYLLSTYESEWEFIVFNNELLKPLSETDKHIGFVWGYQGGGVIPSAKVILNACYPDDETILELDQAFAINFLGSKKFRHKVSATITKDEVIAWVNDSSIVKRACKELGMTQKELAEKLGVDDGTVRKWASEATKTPEWAERFISLIIEHDKTIKGIEHFKYFLDSVGVGKTNS